MTDYAADVLADAFVRGCASIGQGLGAIAVALRPSLEAGGCAHPEDMRDHAGTTMGHIRWTCSGCGFEYDAKTQGA